MDRFTTLFLILLIVATATELWLAQRHIRHVANRRRSVPAPFRGKIPLRAHRKAADYTVTRMRFGMVEALYGTFLLLLWTVGGGLNLLDNAWRLAGGSPLVTGTMFVLSVFVIGAIGELPFTAYRTFNIETRFGFNRMSRALFVSDALRRLLLLLVFGAPVIAAALWLMQSAGDAWWLYVWFLWVALSLVMIWIYPAWIAPLFNRFKPLAASQLRNRISALLRRTGFRSRGIYVIDSSKRTTHGNAYFTGLGRSKRIVFFDTLLKTLNAREIEAVLAHELGHFKLAHILKRMVLMFVSILAALALLGWLATQTWFYQGLGMQQPSPHAALTLFVMVGPLFSFFLQPLFAWGSRKHEYEADRFAATTTSAKALASALVKLYRDNAATLTPDPVYSAFYDSHPPALRRISRLLGEV
ncbi:MAG TPA: M48 family metallopeptidase [Burkholderiales bacterium]|nr:M48 family metallopeptidase [Burkholderiales bacterium]